MHKSSFMQMVLGYPAVRGISHFFPGDNCTGHCSIDIFLGHPLKLKGVGANIILGDFRIVTPRHG